MSILTRIVTRCILTIMCAQLVQGSVVSVAKSHQPQISKLWLLLDKISADMLEILQNSNVTVNINTTQDETYNVSCSLTTLLIIINVITAVKIWKCRSCYENEVQGKPKNTWTASNIIKLVAEETD